MWDTLSKLSTKKIGMLSAGAVGVMAGVAMMFGSPNAYIVGSGAVGVIFWLFILGDEK